MPANKTDTVWFAAAIKKHTHEKKFDRKPRMIQRFNHVFFLLLRIKRIFDRFFDLGVPFDYYVLWTHGQNKRKERACCKLHRVSMTLFFGANELLVWFLIISNNQVRMCCICWAPNISIHSNISPNQPELVMLSIGPGIYQFIILNVLQMKKKQRANRFIFEKWQEPANDHCIVSMYAMHRERCGKFFYYLLRTACSWFCLCQCAVSGSFSSFS